MSSCRVVLGGIWMRLGGMGWCAISWELYVLATFKVTVYTHGDFIVLPQWETRRPAP